MKVRDFTVRLSPGRLGFTQMCKREFRPDSDESAVRRCSLGK